MSNQHDLIEKQKSLKVYEYKTFLSPLQWYRINDLPNYNWTTKSFKEENIKLIPSLPGIYSFMINPQKTNHPQRFLGYIGKTTRSLRTRFSEYLKEMYNPKGRPKLIWFLNQWEGYIEFCYIDFEKSTKINEIENRLNDAFLPPFNSDFTAEINNIIKPF